MTLKALLTSKLSLLALTALLIILAGVQYRHTKERRSINQEIENLRQQQAELEQSNKELNDSLSYLSTADYKDRIARLQFGLKREGEGTYAFTEGPEGQGTLVQSGSGFNQESNFQLWWSYFFKK